ncbi:tetratricopeptide repeat protein [Kitasatospora sp. NPDC002040]|uniref:tetratricopeptide repeat protein n=1 Tax=Kitasatospora sp. NPDC002040 TaxID=3154661 RepID=UPI003317E8BB
MLELYERLRELREQARAEREAGGLRFSALAVEQAVRASARPGAAGFTARRINDWAPADRRKARLPGAEDRGCFLALVELWSTWAELPFDEPSWTALLPAQSPSAPGWTNLINDGDFGGTVVMAQTANFTLPERRPGPADLPPLRALPREFTGREAELAALLPLLDPDSEADPVLVTSVAGMGGIGKTTLALAAGHAALANGWFTGALFIDLHGYDDTALAAGQALDSLLRALGVTADRIPPDEDGRAALYRAQLAARGAVLVVADNASRPEQVRSLIPGPGPHRLLVTSRDVLTPIGSARIDLDVLTPDGAVTLLERTLATADCRPERVGSAREDALRLAALCGHLPLALQVTAAQLVRDRHLPVARLADELAEELADTGSRLGLLEDGDLAVRASLERSLHPLPPTAVQLLELLALAPGPDVSTESAAHLAGRRPRDTRRLLTTLSSASLLRQSPGGGRWTLHDLVRDYAAEHARAHGHRHGPALLRLAQHYRSLASAADQLLHRPFEPGGPSPFPDRAAALAWMEAERRNLVAAVGSAPVDPVRSVLLANSLAQHLHRQRWFDDLHAVSSVALGLAQGIGDRSREALAWLNLAGAHHDLRQFDRARTANRRSLALLQELGDRHGEATAWNNLGNALHELHLFDEAEDATRRALTLYQELGDRHGEAAASGNLGSSLRELRRFEEGHAAHRHSLARHQELGDRHGEATAWNNLGASLHELRRFEEAENATRHALTLYQELGDRHGEARTRNNLGISLHGLRRFEEARTAHGQALAAHEVLGDRHSQAISWYNLGNALRGLERFEEAEDAARRALTLYQELGDRHSEAAAWNGLSAALHGLRLFEQARDADRCALLAAQELGDRHVEALTWGSLGASLRELGRLAEAEDATRRAVTLCRQLDDPHGEAVAHNNLGTVLRDLQRFEEAEQAARQAAELLGAPRLQDAYLEGRALGELADTLAAAGRAGSEVRAVRASAAAAYRRAGEPAQALAALDGTDLRH